MVDVPEPAPLHRRGLSCSRSGIRLDFCLPGNPGALLWLSAVAAGFPLVLPSAP